MPYFLQARLWNHLHYEQPPTAVRHTNVDYAQLIPTTHTDSCSELFSATEICWNQNKLHGPLDNDRERLLLNTIKKS